VKQTTDGGGGGETKKRKEKETTTKITTIINAASKCHQLLQCRYQNVFNKRQIFQQHFNVVGSGSVVVKALCYKSEGRGFKSR
jgi:hypothetical protein